LIAVLVADVGDVKLGHAVIVAAKWHRDVSQSACGTHLN